MAPNGGQNVKWMTAISVWLFLAMTSVLVTAKVSLLWILRLYKYEQIHPATWYVIMLVLLEAPLVTHVVHLVWNTPFINGSRSPLPRKSVIVMGILGSISESVAGVVFATEISYVLPEPVLLLLPAAVFTLHLMLSTSAKLRETSNIKANLSTPFGAGSTKTKLDFVENDKNSKGRQTWQNCVCILMSSYLLWAPAAVATLLHVWSTFNMRLGACVMLGPAILVLSATWSPHLQSAVVKVKAKGQGGTQKNSTLSLIYTLFRIGTVPLTLYLVMFFKIEAFRHDVLGFLRHVSDDVTDTRVWLPVFLASLFGLVSVMMGGVAAKVALLTPGMRIPAFVTPFASFLAATVLWRDLESKAFWELSGTDIVTWTASGVAFVAWLIPFLMPGVPVVKSPRQLLRPFSDNFHSFTWRPFFLEQHLMLNTHVNDNEKSSSSDSSNDTSGRGSAGGDKRSGRDKMKKVYICTTMYRETETEMRRYLNSLKRAFTSEKLLNVELETHIFLDNCVEPDLRVNSYARQLLTLLTTELNVSPAALSRHSTPYGCQVTCRCLGGHLLYVHCKNGREFKPKKRWSQVMYMNYILNHRAARSSQNESPTPPSLREKWTDTYNDTNERTDHFNEEKEEEERQGKIWFCSEQMLTTPASEALQRMFRDHPSILSNFSAMQGPGDKLSGANANRHGDESSSESALGSSHDTGSEEWREHYTVSVDNSTSGDSSDADDDSEVFSFMGKAKVASRKPTSAGKEARAATSIFLENNKLAASSVFSSRASNASSDSDNRDLSKVNQTPLCNLQDAGKGNSRKSSQGSDFWASFGSHLRNPSTHSLSHPEKPCASNDDVYILATDADTEFGGSSVRILLDQCEADHSLGAVCGRTVPVGGLKPIVWYQKFEYAKDFWLVKSSQNVIGSVTCCPGCFSLYRGSAIRDVMTTFSRPSSSAFDTLVKDHGEDRWLCTLMMQKGWKLEYADNCHNSTHCPETCGEFLRQRRRWVLSELSNMVLIFKGLGGLVKGNSTFSALFVLSLLHMFIWVLLSPSTTLVVTCAAFHILFHLPMLYSAPVAYCVLLGFFVVCVAQPRHTQRMMTQAIVAVMVGVMVAISAGFVDYVVQTLTEDVKAGSIEFKPYFLVLVLIGGVVYAAILHAHEGMTLIYGLVYASIFPAMFLALPVYSIANMVDTSWGTRELVSEGLTS
ncbi:hypothetical protein V1264_022464 [Littorina saxatilis]|uniref:chitin synthase n=1 Tax=Littorina saxatilis TaxID=31220 RepID=A0AAN9AKD2_9CAEN